MAFMQPETYHGPYYVVDTGACGITFIPCDVHPGASDPAELRDYVESTSDPTGWELEVKTGWLGRYQAPGYLDCTDWTPGDSEEELLAELRDMYGGDDDESDDTDESGDTDDVPNMDAIKPNTNPENRPPRRTKAEALATVLGGRVTPVGVEWIRPDGRIISIGLDGTFLCTSEQAYRYTSEQAHLDFRARVDAIESPVIDGWFDDPEDRPWGGKDWAQDLARLLGGGTHHTGGNNWTVDLVRADGRYVRIGAESASIFPSADDFANMRDAEHFDWC